LNFPALIAAGGDTGDVLILSFVNEANVTYHGPSLLPSMDAPTADYIANYNNFVNTVYPTFASFRAVNYPIVTSLTC